MVHMLSGQYQNLRATALPDVVSTDVKNLVDSMLQDDSSLRPTAEAALGRCNVIMTSKATESYHNDELLQENGI